MSESLEGNWKHRPHATSSRVKLFMVESSPSDLCEPCGGACCQRLAGFAIPEDLYVSSVPMNAREIQHLKEMVFDSGLWSLDCFDSLDDGPLWLVRPRHTNDKPGQIATASWGGVCVNWSKEWGCSMSNMSRPAQCKDLKARETEDESCVGTSSLSRIDYAMAWIHWQKVFNGWIDGAGQRKTDEESGLDAMVGFLGSVLGNESDET